MRVSMSNRIADQITIHKLTRPLLIRDCEYSPFFTENIPVEFKNEIIGFVRKKVPCLISGDFQKTHFLMLLNNSKVSFSTFETQN